MQVIVEVLVESLPPTSEPVPWWAIAVPVAVAVLLIIAVFVVLYIVSTSQTYIPQHMFAQCVLAHMLI